jgi:hypothetical protein
MSVSLKSKTVTIDYWDCGLTGKGHTHQSERTAQKCYKSQNTDMGKLRKMQRKRQNDIANRWLECRNMSQAAREFDVSSETSRRAVYDRVRAAIWMRRNPHAKEYITNNLVMDQESARIFLHAAEKSIPQMASSGWARSPDNYRWTYGLDTMQANTLLAAGLHSAGEVVNAILSNELKDINGLGKKGAANIEMWAVNKGYME